jgi:Putative amidoligase enzyme
MNSSSVDAPEDAFGLEIELEGQNLSSRRRAITDYWTVHNDGSLRAPNPEDMAIEYVFHRPLGLQDTTTALTNMMTFLNQDNVTVFESERTSIHVHVNVLQNTLKDILNFIVLSIIFDELFVGQNGPERVGNNFCLRAKDAKGQLIQIRQQIENTGFPFSIDQANRYNSVNIASLNRFGTIEFRSLECTIDLQRVLHWVNTLNTLKQFAKTFNSPEEIIYYFSSWGNEEFIDRVLGPYAEKYKAVPHYGDMLFRGVRIAQEIAYCTDWKRINRNQERMMGNIRVDVTEDRPVSQLPTATTRRQRFDPSRLSIEDAPAQYSMREQIERASPPPVPERTAEMLEAYNRMLNLERERARQSEIERESDEEARWIGRSTY